MRGIICSGVQALLPRMVRRWPRAAPHPSSTSSSVCWLLLAKRILHEGCFHPFRSNFIAIVWFDSKLHIWIAASMPLCDFRNSCFWQSLYPLSLARPPFTTRACQQAFPRHL